jgi:Flp pilus assembly protein TadG
VKSALHRKLREDSRGQALVEFALVVPILMLLLLGIVDFARAWNVYEVLTDAAREGARVIVVDNGLSNDDAIIRIQEAGARAGITIAATDVQITETDLTTGSKATTVRIEYQHRLQFVGALMSLVGDGNITLVTEFSMRNE